MLQFDGNGKTCSSSLIGEEDLHTKDKETREEVVDVDQCNASSGFQEMLIRDHVSTHVGPTHLPSHHTEFHNLCTSRREETSTNATPQTD